MDVEYFLFVSNSFQQIELPEKFRLHYITT